jgi:hypothetical protein
MRRHLIVALASLSATLAVGAPATPAPAKPASAASNYERTKARITELLGLRRKPSPLPPVLPNPFAAAAAPAADAGPAAPTMPVDLLTRLAQSLKIGGVIQIGGTPSLIINSNPYRAGAWVPIREGETVHRLRIKQITATRVTFEMEGEETTLPLR